MEITGGRLLLTLILGRAGTGKTAFVLGDIRRRMNAGESNLLLIVPEQYSHYAERQLSAVCGDKLSMHGETLSFTRLCGRVFAETGGAPAHMMDAGGQILLMYLAIESAAERLQVFGSKGLRAHLLEKILDAVKEFKSLRLTPEVLEQIAGRTSGPLRDKLNDLSLIYSAYDALLHTHGGDAADRMTLLADKIGESTVGTTGHVYFDGFNDFTAQELSVIKELLRKNANITVCLTCDPDDDSEIFEHPRKTVGQLRRIAGEYCVEAPLLFTLPISESDIPNTESQNQNPDSYKPKSDIENQNPDSHKPKSDMQNQNPDSQNPTSDSQNPKPETHIPNSTAPELTFLEKHLFSHTAVKFAGQCSAIMLCVAPSRYSECEYAASKVWELVRGGYRWRDIGVMARNWEDYGPICENVFEKYGVPFFSSGRTEILDKPPAALIDAALDIAASGWEYKPAFRYLKTGLTDISAQASAELENYILKWNIRGTMWNREWIMPASGYGGNSDDNTDLIRLNSLRQYIAGPIIRLRDGIKGVTGADAKLRALYTFLEDIMLPERLEDKARELEKRGETRLADEYAQVWDIVSSSIDQMFEILGDTLLNAVEFRRLFTLTLSQYDVGVIPVSLDRTMLGGMAMSRRRDLKCLIILGATDEDMPKLTKVGGALSDNERMELCRLGADMPAGLDERLCREMNMLYSTLTLPSRELVVMYPNGGGGHPSSIIKRIKTMFDISEISLREEEYMSSAPTPCMELAAFSGNNNNSCLAAAAREYFYGIQGKADEMEDITLRPSSSMLNTELQIPGLAGASLWTRQRKLTTGAAKSLYGSKLSLSASRVDKYYSCPFQHFLQSGLRLSPRVPAEFDASTAGIFMHYVLEGVAREISATVGYKNTDETLCRDLTMRYIEKFVSDVLLDFEGKNARFVYLFRRFEGDTVRIVLDMLEELKRSDFEPLDFELDFSVKQGDGTSVSLQEAEEPSPYFPQGMIDRVDGFKRNDTLYLRVMDYKTGKKTLSLPDVLHGRDMQMLIYLFALQFFGKERYGSDIAPAGVLYVPARDVILKAPRNATKEELDKMRENELRRGGLVLNDPDVLEAMENGDEKKYLPVKYTKDGAVTGDSLVNAEQIALLSKHVDRMLRRAVSEILGGSIECSPYYKNATDNACLYCEYSTVCCFDEEAGDKRMFVPKMKTPEVWEAIHSNINALCGAQEVRSQ